MPMSTVVRRDVDGLDVVTVVLIPVTPPLAAIALVAVVALAVAPFIAPFFSLLSSLSEAACREEMVRGARRATPVNTSAT